MGENGSTWSLSCNRTLRIDSSRLWAPTRLSDGVLSDALGVDRQATREGGASHGDFFLGSGQRLRGGMKLRNNRVRRHSHETLFHCRPASAVWAVLIVPLFATIAAPPAAAQIT